MIKYVLNSGGIGNSTDGGSKFFNEIIENLGSDPNVLFCFFAQPKNEWQDKFWDYISGFASKLKLDVNPNFALAQPDMFAEQLEWCDAVYILGGDERLLEPLLRRYDIPQIWDGKVVATNSASSNLLSAYYWTSDQRKCVAGLGILPIKFLPHFESDYSSGSPKGHVDWYEAFRKLSDFGDPNLPIHALPEGEFVMITK